MPAKQGKNTKAGETRAGAELLNSRQKKEGLARLEGWKSVKGRAAIKRSFVFSNFREAFAFMSEAALYAEKMDHHPEWFNVFKTVDVTLSTHDAGGVTEKDLKLASAMQRIAARFGL